MKLKLTLEYPGGAFSGWQCQPNLRTVQGELERALELFVNGLIKQSAGSDAEPASFAGKVTGSGRTDAGVHALGQVASVEWPEELALDCERVRRALNGITPRELVVRRVEQAADSFDARLSPHLKCYTYDLLLRDTSAGFFEGRVWCVSPRLDLPEMIRAARLIAGQHDFSSFRASDCSAQSAIRTVLTSELTRIGFDAVRYTIQGKGFLKQMVRIIVGTLVEVGRGRITLDAFARLFSEPDRQRAGQTAPAYGLTLQSVCYDVEGWNY